MNELSLIEMARQQRAKARLERLQQDAKIAQSVRMYETKYGIYRKVCRGWVQVDEQMYWAKELEDFDGQRVMLSNEQADGSRNVFLHDDFICCVQKQVVDSQGFAKKLF